MNGLTGITLFFFLATVCVSALRRHALVCEHTTMYLSCGTGREIYIQSASYGRRSDRLCTTERMSNTNCHSTRSMSVVSNACDGRSSCNVRASNSYFSDPCLYTFKYLEVLYACASWTQRRVCEHSTLSLSCPSGQALIIGDALYGRQAGRSVCPHRYIRSQNCRASSSLSEVRNRCEGRNSCSVPATNGVFGDPCWRTYKYLEVQYDCV
ncbi:L-rhamnose-binding lectin CSL3-like [Diadema setosum]|uniref:L-rhamnose-binding lectin CSL3-like n=1 Tax=Diadema setosum TaxID=31175 RepID=UPI003B3A5BC1